MTPQHHIRPDANGFVLCTSQEVHDRVNTVQGGSLRLNWLGTRGCRSEQMVKELEENEANNKLDLTPDFAAHLDISAAAMIR